SATSRQITSASSRRSTGAMRRGRGAPWKTSSASAANGSSSRCGEKNDLGRASVVVAGVEVFGALALVHRMRFELRGAHCLIEVEQRLARTGREAEPFAVASNGRVVEKLVVDEIEHDGSRVHGL